MRDLVTRNVNLEQYSTGEIRDTDVPADDVSMRSYFFFTFGKSFSLRLLNSIFPEYCASSKVLSTFFDKDVGFCVDILKNTEVFRAYSKSMKKYKLLFTFY